MSDTLAWLCASFWNRVLIVAIILIAAAIAASLLWIAVYAVRALRDRITGARTKRRKGK